LRPVFILGVGLHPFGRWADRGLTDLAAVAIREALDVACATPRDLEFAYVANSYAGLLTGQESVRGQVTLSYCGIHEIPIVNVENACAGGSTALREAWLSVGSGLYDFGLALGVEKLYVGDTARTVKAIATSTDIALLGQNGFQFTASYAVKAKRYMERTGARIEDIARVVVKNRANAAQNPYAQYRKEVSVEEVLSSRLICDPLRLFMCSSIADGAAAVIVGSEEAARRLNLPPRVRIAASSLVSGAYSPNAGNAIVRAASDAYRLSGFSPDDVEVAEVHDASANAEFEHLEDLGFCPEGQGAEWIRTGRCDLHGTLPVNPSGGLIGRGHPVAATGLAQLSEIFWQITGRAGPRQVPGRHRATPRIGLTLNTGGRIEEDRAAAAVHILAA
jgi:acetyl-CoA acetyltransferase